MRFRDANCSDACVSTATHTHAPQLLLLGLDARALLHPRRGAMVLPLSADELRDLHEVRLMVEVHAAQKICAEARPLPPELTELCDLHEATPASDLLGCVEINRLFHQALVAAAVATRTGAGEVFSGRCLRDVVQSSPANGASIAFIFSTPLYGCFPTALLLG